MYSSLRSDRNYLLVIAKHFARLLIKIFAPVTPVLRIETPVLTVKCHYYSPSGQINGLIKVLTPREFEILNLMFEGFSFSKISQRTGLAPLEIEKHHKRLLKKFGARNSIELIRKALEDSWLKL